MKKLYFFVVVWFLLGVGISNAQYTDLLNFDGTNGSFPGGDLILTNGRLYGLTSQGTAGWGCVFSIDTNGNGYNDVYFFNGTSTNGSFAYGSLTLMGKVLYGITEYGGRNDDGVVFSVDTNGIEYNDLLDFNGTNGSEPQQGSLVLSGGILYGMTYLGGANDLGCVFSIDTDGNRYRDLLDFNGYEGAYPYGSLVIYQNVLYGMTSDGGVNHDGNIFSIDTDGSRYRDLLDFNGTNGMEPLGALIISGKILYGMTDQGGVKDSGCIFSIDTDGSRYNDMFDFTKMNGYYPDGSLLRFGSKLYGMTTGGGLYNYGCIFSMDTNGIGYKVMFSFNGTNGESPWGSLIFSENVLYGMTHSGGSNFDGVVFKLDTNLVTSLNEVSTAKGGINVYPNPNLGEFNIEYSLAGQNKHLPLIFQVYNVLGEKVFSYAISSISNINKVSMSVQSAGIYIYKVITESGELIGEGEFVLE